MRKKMQLSPLQLKHYHFTELKVEVVEGVSPEEVDTGNTPYPLFDGVEWDSEVFLGIPDMRDDHLFAVRVHVYGKPLPEAKFPYCFSVRAEGVFEIDHDGDLAERKRLVVVNGAGVLYGAVREQLLLTTSRFSHGAMLLPTVDFRALSQELQDEQAASDNLAKGRKAPRAKRSKA